MQRVGNIEFGTDIGLDYQRSVEAPFFRHFLKGGDGRPDFEALMFDTGTKVWKKYATWPPENSERMTLYLSDRGKLSTAASPSQTFGAFTSDPRDPVPYREKKNIKFRFTPRPYMTDDQRFAAARDDVLVYQTQQLAQPLTITGDLNAHLRVSTSQTDADWVVKLIDVYPDATPSAGGQGNATHQNDNPRESLFGYQQLVRSEVIRGRFRKSYTVPQPFVPSKVETIDLPLQDVHHTFKRGHRIMVQIQSTWFPLIDRNPQKYVDNIFKATPEDFVAAEHRVYHGGPDGTRIELKVSR
jgi:putative CocE/NonD family hydrolase